MRSASISKGLVTKSTAPSFIASTAVATVRVAESTITGGGSVRSASSRRKSRPVRPGITRSSSTASIVVLVEQRECCIDLADGRHLELVLEQHPQRLADARLVIDDEDVRHGWRR